jgi:acetyltransferase-like isoleucine patch superfamily enzyme
MGGAMSAALRRSEAIPAPVAVAPPTALPRAAGWRDRRRLARAVRGGAVSVAGDGPVVIGRRVAFDVAPGGRVVLGAGVALGDGCRLHVGRDAVVEIGAGTALGERCVITAHAGVRIGARCLLADEVVLVDGNPRFADVERPIRAQGVEAAPIAIGDDVRIGPSAAVLPGVTIRAGTAVGAHAVITR